MTKAEQHHKSLNDNFNRILSSAFEKRYNLKLETSFDVFGSGQLVSRRADGEEMTVDQYKFVDGFSKGYAAAMNHVYSL